MKDNYPDWLHSECPYSQASYYQLYYQKYLSDNSGNIIDNKKLDYKDTQSVTSQGNYLSIISDGYQNNYIGKYATAWSIYNKDGDRVATIPSSALLYALGKSDEQIKKSIDSASKLIRA